MLAEQERQRLEMERRRAEMLEAKRQEDARLHKEKVMDRIKRNDAAMVLFKAWIR